MDRAAAVRLGNQARDGGLALDTFAATVNGLPVELRLVALAAYTQERKQPGGPSGYPRQAVLWTRQPGNLNACPRRDQWNATAPHVWPAA